MAQLPVLSGEEVVKIFGRFDWVFVRQSGSHMVNGEGWCNGLFFDPETPRGCERNFAKLDTLCKSDDR